MPCDLLSDLLQVARSNPVPILLRLARKKVYQCCMRWYRRAQLLRGGVQGAEQRLLRALPDFDNSQALLRHLERREEPAFFWSASERNDILDILAREFPDSAATTIDDADELLDHVFDLLGSGKIELGADIDWSRDFKSGFRWPRRFYTDIVEVDLSNGADVKVPRELSRCHHFVTLGKAYWHTGDEVYAREFVAQVNDWIQENPPRMTVNWCCAMDVAIRLVNWIWGYQLFAGSADVDDNTRIRLLESILTAAEFIEENLEYHGVFSGNHHVADLAGLAFAGIMLPELAAAGRWRRMAFDGLEEQIASQIHRDGTHFEGSTNYHRLVLEMLVSVVLLGRKNGVEVSEATMARLEKMFEFVLSYTAPDGRAPQIGDTDNGRLHVLSRVASNDHRYLLATGAVLFGRGDFKRVSGGFHEETLWLLGPGSLDEFDAIETDTGESESRAFETGGYYLMRRGNSYLVATCGAPGQRGRASHSHNDTLSFELMADGVRFIVDPGTYIYTADPAWRNRFRSTAYHNTVTVDGREMNNIPGDRMFRLEARTVPTINLWESTAEADHLDAQHSGYEQLEARATHRRQFYFDKAVGLWVIRDTVTGVGAPELCWHFHFDAGIVVSEDAGMTVTARTGETGLRLEAHTKTELKLDLEQGWVSPRYGVKEAATVARFRCVAELPVTVAFVLQPHAEVGAEASTAEIGAHSEVGPASIEAVLRAFE